jgi:oxygen-independent coproporphyrinogen-3 oxidase
LDPSVQRAINRVQSEEQTMAVIDAARDAGFRSISIDLIYGLPNQSRDSFQRTLQSVLALSPDRISLFNYAHMPTLFKTQRGIREEELPSPAVKLEILHNSIQTLTGAGYAFIGMDHFAKPDDELAIAQRQGRLHRNFQGYATHADCDLIGLGVTAIGSVGQSFAQNVKTLDDYYQRIDAGQLAVYRGAEMDADDHLRRAVIMALICQFELDIGVIEQRFAIDFGRYFAPELSELAQMVDDGLVAIDQQAISVLPPGRLLIRNICMVFDRYLRQPTETARYSKAI